MDSSDLMEEFGDIFQESGGLMLHHADPAKQVAARKALQTRLAKLNGAPR
jgi:hypothetical protein